MRTMESGADAGRVRSAVHWKVGILCSLLLLTLVPLGSSFAALPGNESWSDQFFLPGLDGSVTAIALSGTDVIVAGDFKFADGLRVNHIARWDGSSWSAFGTGIASEIKAITVNGGNVVAAYQISTVQGSRVVQWTGSSWQQLAAFTNGDITTATEWQGNLVVAGSFQNVDANPLPYLAVWDGANWSALGSGPGANVSALKVIGTTLYAATGNSLLKWDGVSWAQVGSAFAQPISALGEFNGAPAVASGSSSLAEWRVATWNGSSWDIRGGAFAGPINALVQNGASLIATGGFLYANGSPLAYLARWDGISWTQVGSGLSSDGSCLANSGSELLVGGKFTTIGPKAVHYLSAYDGVDWKQYFSSTFQGQGILGEVRCFAQYNGQLVAGGAFSTAGGQVAYRVAAQNNGQWVPLGSGLRGVVFSLCEFEGKLIAGGVNLNVGAEVHALFAWDGSNWAPFGPPESFPMPAVYDLVPYNNKLVAVGIFTSIGGTAASYVAAFDGVSWSPLGGGWTGATNDAVVYDGRLIVGGTVLSQPAGIADIGLAAWNGVAWERVSPSAPQFSRAPVYDLGVYNGNLEITTADNVVTWHSTNPTEWHVNHIPGSPEALTTSHFFASMVVAGQGQAESDPVHLLQFDGAEWQSMGDGVSKDAGALFRFGDQLFVGGVFDEAGGKASAGVAVWQPYGPQCCIGPVGNYDSDPDDITDISDLQALIDFLFYGGVINPCPGEVDIDASGSVDISDLTWLISFMFTGEPLPSCP